MYREPQRPMHVDAKDWTPPSALRGMLLSMTEVVGGLGFTGGIALLIGLTFAVWVVGGGGSSASSASDDEPVIEEEVIAARFVKLGRRFEELPNRNVPVRDTAPAAGVAVSTNPRDHDVPDAGPRPPDPMDDPMTRLLNRADLFAEIAEQREQEGDPDGIEEGTETEAAAGDLYAGQIYATVRRGWVVDETISSDELRTLRVAVSVRVDEETLEIREFRLRGESGNPGFDQSVVAQMERLRAANVAIPEPPILERDRYVGRWFTLDFSGRNASR